ncbi:precorrin-2 dehydrogenase/sirohydrochlorin ferrochelatase family protein [Salsipaludibacter albus]|uniref:precorrin-2 dehydrogenase/sirohydrochlorin ferrochelatase family protein n=1 Tax=Salsipaludibacter albus TaxID=2849650 RepID=UPI001EE4C1B6|nr:NAD(P)-dependent oxidoreductase [Salsipaludibacter albus]MBY5161833.1 hypothetical protein [Salsipaludibacter albus]
MSQFGYVVALELHDRTAVLVGGGREAVHRLDALLAAGARVRLVTPDPSDELRVAVEAAGDRVTWHDRDYRDGDLADTTIAIATGEDDGTDVAALWDESRRRHVTTSVLDDLDHTDFAQPALVRRGDLRIAISTGGSAPALARRYREDLEVHYGPEHADLVDAAAEARDRAGRRPVSFERWAGRWSCAVWDLHGLARRVREGGRAGVVDHLVTTLLPPATTDPAAVPDRTGTDRDDDVHGELRPRPTKGEVDPADDAATRQDAA